MRLSKVIALALCSAGLAFSAWTAAAAGELGKLPGSRLLELCAPAARAAGASAGLGADAHMCLAFIDGFVWGHAWASWREAKDMWFCLPQGFVPEQGARDVIGYLTAHTDRLDEDSHLLVFLALTAAYPCKP